MFFNNHLYFNGYYSEECAGDSGWNDLFNIAYEERLFICVFLYFVFIFTTALF